MKTILICVVFCMVIVGLTEYVFAGDNVKTVPCGDPHAMFKVNCDDYTHQPSAGSSPAVVSPVAPASSTPSVNPKLDAAAAAADISFYGFKYGSGGALHATSASSVFMSYSSVMDALSVVGGIIGKIREARAARFDHLAAKVYFRKPVRFIRIPSKHKQIMKVLHSKSKALADDCDWEVEVKDNTISPEGRLSSLTVVMEYPKKENDLPDSDKCSRRNGEEFFSDTSADLAALLASRTVYNQDM